MSFNDVNLEDQLREALKREPAPADFAARVLARTRPVTIWRRPAALALAASLTIAALIPAAIEYRQRQRAREQQEAKEQLIAALVITRTQLDQLKERIQKTTRSTR